MAANPFSESSISQDVSAISIVYELLFAQTTVYILGSILGAHSQNPVPENLQHDPNFGNSGLGVVSPR